MSDDYSAILADYALAVKPEDVSSEVAHEVERRLLDSLGVSYAAFDQDLPVAARAYAQRFPMERGSTIWGTDLRTTPEIAAFVNGAMTRYLDFNDTYLSLEPLHPSDMLPALLALAEWNGSSPSEFLTASAVAYEVSVTLCDAASLRTHGWDHVNYIGIGTALGAARLLGLDRAATEHALSIAAVPHASMRQTRAGELSMWKGAAAANSARNGTFAALVASAGVSGPFAPFTGEMGFFRQMFAGGSFDDAVLGGLREKRPPTRILDTYIKYWPVEYHAQSAVDAALQLHAEMPSGAELDRVEIDTFKASYEIIAKDPEKWRPKTRETADHSLPYITVAALMDGHVDLGTFAEERFTDAATVAFLAEKVELRDDDELSAGYPDGIPNRITVWLKDGSRLSREVRYPRGHARNPMSDDEVKEKFLANAEPRLGEERARALVDVCFDLHAQEGLERLLAAIRG